MRTAATLLIALAAPAPAQDVAYEKYQLDNGMTVILHEDHSLPQAEVNLLYRVGSKDEPPARSGFAHLFEHLMFMGTERVPEGQFDEIMESGGGFNNASTSTDYTSYYDSGPSALLPTLLWLEADRMEALGASITQEKLDKQRDVVRNERRQSYENRPYGRAELESSTLLYPPGHPYHLSVIGTHADLEAATVEDVQRFFATWYVPNNASLVVAGDFEPDVVKPLVARLFGSLPRGADPRHVSAPPVTLAEDVAATSTDAVQYAATTLYWHSPAFYAPGDAELDLAGAILADGVSSRLYQDLVVDRELAVEVDAAQVSRLLGSTFQVSALARPGVELEELEAAIDAVLADFVRDGPTEDELERRRARMEAQTLRGLQSIQAKADRLNRYELYFGEPNSFRRDLDRYRVATTEDVRRVASEVLGAKRAVVRVLPQPEEPTENPRDQRPELATERDFAPPAPERFELSNGLFVELWARPDLPLVELAVLLPVGASHDPPGKGGLAALTADMLDEGSGERDAVDFADALERLGATLVVDAGHEWIELRLTALARNFDASLALLADALLRPTFAEAEWERVHALHLAALRREQDSPTGVARDVSLRAFFGPDHAYGRPVGGTPESAAAVLHGDLIAFFVDHFGPGGARVIVAGDLSREAAESALATRLGGWKGLFDDGEPGFPPPGFPPPANERTRALVVDRPGAVQTVIRFVLPAPAYADSTRPARELIAAVLGGSFTSRLNANLREDKGYTYGARAGYFFGPSAGYLIASSSVRADVTGAALAEFLSELETLRAGGVTAAEAGKARAGYRLRTLQRFAGLEGIVDAAAERARQGLPFESLAADLEAVAALGPEQLDALAPSTLPLDRAVLVLVGDRAAIEAQLSERNLPLPALEDVAASGEPLVR